MPARFVLAFALVSLLWSCRALRQSPYAKANRFSYANEQPRFHFANDSLAIIGSWHYASSARAIPDPGFLPPKIKRMLYPLVQQSGPVLFATWVPQRKKYEREGEVPVTKRAVRYRHALIAPLYVVVLIRNGPFSGDTTVYQPKGKNNDFQFTLYEKTPSIARHGNWVTEVIASSTSQTYDFVCIVDGSYAQTPNNRSYLADQFLEDIATRFETK